MAPDTDKTRAGLSTHLAALGYSASVSMKGRFGHSLRENSERVRNASKFRSFEAFRLAEREKIMKICTLRGYTDSPVEFSHSLGRERPYDGCQGMPGVRRRSRRSAKGRCPPN